MKKHKMSRKDWCQRPLSQLLTASMLSCTSLPAMAVLNILNCEPEWAALPQELGGDKLKIASATPALPDPHQIEARPSQVAKTRNADLPIGTGLEPAVGSIPTLQQQSGNANIADGQSGHFETGAFLNKLNLPDMLDRREADVHALGNPPIEQHPHNISRVADALAKRLAELDPANADYYLERQKNFSSRWHAAILTWEQQSALLNGEPIVEQNKKMADLLQWLNLPSVATLEPKPGVEPSADHLSQLLNQLQKQPAKLVLRAAYQDARESLWLAERTQIPVIILPFTVGGDFTKEMFGVFEITV